MVQQKEKIKLSVYLSEKMNDDIIAIAEEMGLSRQDYIRHCIAQANLGYKKAFDGIDSMVQTLSKKEA